MINGYLCDCKDGFEGTNCEININECDPDPCLNGATCLDLDSRYECQCQIGFKGNIMIPSLFFYIFSDRAIVDEISFMVFGRYLTKLAYYLRN